MRLYLIIVLLFLNIAPASACEFAEPIACKKPTLILHKKSFVELKKKLKSYGLMLSKYSKISSKEKCTKALEINYQISFIEKYAKKNNDIFCKEHVKVLVLQSEALIDLSSSEHKNIINKKAKLDLIDSGMDVSEALVRYKNKHPVF